ncbi:MAG: hypothetical protein M3Q50_08490 [Chloroflexota bacterium]|nr:hypothetical protein [Chloroflexota bacterium]
MRKNQFPRAAVFGLAALLSAAVLAPVTVQSQELNVAMAPAESNWDETSGYAALETSRATFAISPAPSGAAESRATAAQLALDSGDLGSMQEQALAAVVAAGISWDAASGYGAVEASRATVEPSQVTIDGYATP